MNWKYLKYVLRHKWFVLLECVKMGLPLWVGIIHDLSKFTPSEFSAYANWFYGGWRQDNYTGKSDAPPGLKGAYDRAWNHHMKANPHHWEYWIMCFGDDKNNWYQTTQLVLEMPDRYRREMLADWRGAGRAMHGYDDTFEFYMKKRNAISLHPKTRDWVEFELGVAFMKTEAI